MLQKIKNIKTPDIYEVPISTIRKHFLFSYCCTAHSVQGRTIKENSTIFDYKFYFVNRKWIWTALGRCSDLNNVYFYDYSEDKEFNMNLIKSYFNKKNKRLSTTR